MHLAPAEPGSEKLLAESREEAFRCVKRRLYVISNSSHCVGGITEPREAEGCLPVTSQSLGLLSPPSLSPFQDLIKQGGNSFTVAQYQRNWTLTGLVQSLRPERRKKTLEGLPLGGRGGDTGTSEINLTGKGRKVR